MEFELVAGNLALDFANSVHDHGAPDPQDDFKTYDDLVDWCAQTGLIDTKQRRELHRKNPAEAKRDFERTLQLREAIYAIVVSRLRGKPPPTEALHCLNRHFGRAMAAARLQSVGKHFELTWGINGSGLEPVWGEIARSAVGLLTSGKLRRVRQCEGDSCTWLFLDTSRNGLRRWCDMQACGNRAKARRFRQRTLA